MPAGWMIAVGLVLLASPVVEAGKAIATFRGASGPVGTIIFTQDDPKKPTRIDVDLLGLNGTSTSWFINAFPVMTDCSMASIGSDFNPTNSTAAVPCPGGSKGCRVGDMTGRHGKLVGPSAKASILDDSVSLAGAASVLYRSVLLTGDDGKVVACATLMDAVKNITTLRAHFTPPQPLQGDIWMVQEANTPKAITTVILDLAYPDGQRLENAMYHVHDGSMLTPDATCSSLGYHFNPSNGPPCTKDEVTWATCELGDISGRHDELNLPANKEGKLLFQDTSLPLSGNNTLANRSIVIHDNKGKRIACAALLVAPTLPFKGSFPDGSATAPSPVRRLRQH